METRVLQDGSESFEVSMRGLETSATTVLFAVGAGGSPERHVTLLDTLAAEGCLVIAPHFERLASPVPTEEQLTRRARRLSLTLDALNMAGSVVVGVGHSIGASTLLAMTGAQMWLGLGKRVRVDLDTRLTKLTLLAPPTGFFRAPGALEAVRLPVLVLCGSDDSITPPAQSEWLAENMPDQRYVEVRIIEGAGHFSYMDLPPPHIVDSMPNKAEFLKEHAMTICDFLLS